MNFSKIIFGICLLCCSISVAFAETDFSEIDEEILDNPPGNETKSNKEKQDKYLKLEREGIKVYVYSSKNSAIGTFKAITHIKASLDSILSVMMNNESCAEWIHGCDKSFVIKNISFNERYHYQICTIPFPFKNRDFIFHSLMQQDPVSKAVTITISSVPEYCNNNQSEQCIKANQSELLRVRKSIGTYKLEPDQSGTKITWIQHTDPGGNLPGWLVNQFVKNTPYQSLKKLAEKANEEQYKHAKLIYNIDGVAIAFNNTPEKQEFNMANDFGLAKTF
ncbi:MAG: START domain-containing protein [Gammaproteobacteria bacterium]|nr:START domain-containing protein [Gammaproteobacteria bacterium]